MTAKNKNGICYIIGAGENDGLTFTPGTDDFVIAADAGLLYLQRAGIRTDLAIGDFDTLGSVPTDFPVIALHKEKDDTDLLAAVRQGIAAGYSLFHIYCGTGGRIDHTLANLQILACLSGQHKQGFLFSREQVITAITDSTLTFEPIPSGYVSVFCYTEKAEGVFLEGLKYPLKNAVLTNTFPLGVSNEFMGVESRICVRQGTLLVTFPRSALQHMKG